MHLDQLRGLPSPFASRAPAVRRRVTPSALTPLRKAVRDDAAVAANPRFRAIQRRRTVGSARIGFLVIAAGAAFDALVLADRQPGQAPTLTVLNGAVALLALAGCWGLGRAPLRRYPEAGAFIVTIALTIATVATGIVLPIHAVETIAYLVLLPGLISLILPWRTLTHVRWLVVYGMLGLWYVLFGPGLTLSADDRVDLAVVLLIALGASLAGHVLLQRGRMRDFSQLERIRTLHRQADRDMVELARAHHALEVTARTDALTGAGNRVRLVEDLRTVRAMMSRMGTSHGLIAVDLDRFKAVNDGLGHLAGDEVLRATVGAIAATIRADDAIYRYGGEEFLIVVRVADRVGLATVAERVRAAVEGAGMHHPGNPPHGVVTVSLGAVFVTPADLGESDDAWFARADAALYRAKDTGRNRLELAP